MPQSSVLSAIPAVISVSASAIISHLSCTPGKLWDCCFLNTGHGGVVLCATCQMEADPRAQQTGAWIRVFFSHKIFLKWPCWRHMSYYLLVAAGLNSEIASGFWELWDLFRLNLWNWRWGFFLYSVALLSYHQAKLSPTVFKFINPYCYLNYW